ncbi:major facilitator superfamily protein [Escherichia coli]|nr:major facilitator superfamily protein [Escherichia coli]
MSYMVGMWAFSFILRFFDLQRILTVLAGLAAILMYVFNTGTSNIWRGQFSLWASSPARSIPPSYPGFTADQSTVAKLVNFVLTCGTSVLC